MFYDINDIIAKLTASYDGKIVSYYQTKDDILAMHQDCVNNITKILTVAHTVKTDTGEVEAFFVRYVHVENDIYSDSDDLRTFMLAFVNKCTVKSILDMRYNNLLDSAIQEKDITFVEKLKENPKIAWNQSTLF